MGGCLFQVDRSFEMGAYSRWGLHLRVGVYSRWGLHLSVGVYSRWGLHLRVAAYLRWGLHLRVGAYSRWGLHLRVGVYSRWGLHLRVGAYLRLGLHLRVGAYSNKFGIPSVTNCWTRIDSHTRWIPEYNYLSVTQRDYWNRYLKVRVQNSGGAVSIHTLKIVSEFVPTGGNLSKILIKLYKLQEV